MKGEKCDKSGRGGMFGGKVGRGLENALRCVQRRFARPSVPPVATRRRSDYRPVSQSCTIAVTSFRSSVERPRYGRAGMVI